MFIQNAVLKSISAEGLTFPLSEGSVVSAGGVTGIVSGTLDVRPATNRIYVAVAGTIDLTSDANKGVTFTEEQIKALGGDFNFVPAVESDGGLPSASASDEGKVVTVAADGSYTLGEGGGGGGGDAVVFNILEDEEMNYSLDDGKTFADVSEAYASGATIKWTVMGLPVAFVQYSSSGSSLGNCYLYNVYYIPDELDPSVISEITFEVYNVSGYGVDFSSMTVSGSQS